ncbi:MAG TPA: RsmB/NOP family class I SAM-dependent RNA methyltransferase [Segeticoccus sp.]|uniref:RsmB/NOP family class I SAM-dependent RNA methyltransferase n=1 Tax=Segeticoccus sp. TaxID=2706531 RepID=UPI002D80B1B9|nr:RsmB/NOP family class I SAM-dependent RNA methyltransferase [Segeticoccus sp.]HET8600640.1 RsmB/NOP family class I SAM-dependent RNA methyltransferase [Segeticoccus sp.]
MPERRGSSGHEPSRRRQPSGRGRDSGHREAGGGAGKQHGSRRQPGNRHRSTQRPAERSRRADPARLAAYTVMRRVAEGAFANLELPKVLREHRIHGRDAGFATELTYGATRLRGRYDVIVAHAAGRPLSRIDDAVLDTLRLGAHQLLGMRVETHAAVNETVALARQVNGSGAAGFVNAVLRRVSERDLSEWLDLVAPPVATERADDQDPEALRDARLARLAVVESHPEWIVRALRAALLGHGGSTAATLEEDLTALLRADNTPAAVSLVARPGLVEVAELTEAGATASTLSPVGALLSAGDPGALAAVRDGRAAVQDEGSQLVALALAAARVRPTARSGGDRRTGSDPSALPQSTGPGMAHDGERWLDLCAGPGGKAGLLSALAHRQGARLRANEVSGHRAELVRRTLEAGIRAGARATVTVGDGREVGAEEPGAYDRVLVDVPCTGLGALRRRPEARWRRTPADLSALGSLQRELLTSALEAARPGGVVGYATCSPHLAETTLVVGDVVRKRSDVTVEDARPLFRDASGAQVAGLGEGPHVQLWPHVHGTDAMFFALLRRL